MTTRTGTRRFARIDVDDGRSVFVELHGDRTEVLSAAPWLGGGPTGELLPALDAEARGPRVARRRAPVAPSKILCVGRNYRAHAAELGNEVPVAPLLFFKPPSALIGPDEPIELPPAEISSRVEHEAELAVVVGRRLRRANAEEAASAVFGVTLAGDITARDLQKKDGQWTRAKGMDGFCPVGPVLVSGLALSEQTIACRVGGVLRQEGRASDMIFGVGYVLAYASAVMTLEPGDLLLTGTPQGVGPLVAGDKLEIESPGIGLLSLSVVGPSST